MSVAMTASRSKFTPDGWPTVIPRIIVDDVQGLVQFIKKVFGASGKYEEERPSVLTIGNSKVMISGTGVRDVANAVLYVYVPDVEATYQRAVAADVRVIEKPMDLPYGDRRCMVQDRWGNTWQIATYHKAGS